MMCRVNYVFLFLPIKKEISIGGGVGREKVEEDNISFP